MGPQGAVAVACVAWLSLAAADDSFQAFMLQYGRSYEPDSAVYRQRLRLFRSRAEEVRRLNAEPRRWRAGLGPLADWTEEELQTLRGWRGEAAAETGSAALLQEVQHLPEQFLNWTTLDSLQPIFNQGGCGSCWAVTAATVLAAHAEIHGVPRSFSVQELVDCVPNPRSCGGEGGCRGATVELAMSYAMHLGLADAQQKPYQGRTGQCHRLPVEPVAALESLGALEEEGEAIDRQDQSEAQMREDLAALSYLHAHRDLSGAGLRLRAADAAGPLRGWQRLAANGQNELLRALVTHGPVGVSVAAQHWHLYSSGIFDYCEQDAVIDHAVTLIGYGLDERRSEKFWLIQNSWGPRWGEGGRIRLLREDEPRCGWDRQPEKGTACKGDPAQVRVCGTCGVLYDSVVPHFA